MIIALLATASVCRSQTLLFKDSISIQAKIWSKDENKQIHYSDWNSFVSHRISDIAGIESQSAEKNVAPVATTTNPYYHTENINGRWYVVSENHKPFIVMAVNSIRTSGDNNLPEGFSSIDEWMSTTIDSIRKLGFNTAGCWSDTGAIIRYNQKSTQPLPYTVQLNLLNGFASQQKKINKTMIMMFLVGPGAWFKKQ